MKKTAKPGLGQGLDRAKKGSIPCRIQSSSGSFSRPGSHAHKSGANSMSSNKYDENHKAINPEPRLPSVGQG